MSESVNDGLCGCELSDGNEPAEVDGEVKGRGEAVFVGECSAVNAAEGVVHANLQLVQTGFLGLDIESCTSG